MRRALFAIIGTIAGLVGLLTFKTQAVSAPAAVTATAGDTSGTTGTGSSSSSTSGTSSGSSSGSTGTTTITGSAVSTRYGPVQVKITVTNGKVTSATAVQYPQNNGRDRQINSYAIPILQRESIGVTKANIDMVSGATYTSQGYLASLQSALDKAGLS